jgi:hypothetical protein
MPLRKSANAIKTKIEQGQQEQLSQKIPAGAIRDQLPGKALPPASSGGRGGVQLAGDLGGSASAPTVVGIQTFPVDTATPVATDVLTWDGSAWAPAAPVSGGMTNPMTTAGDIIKGGVAGAAGRLGIGNTGDVLTVVAGAPAWVAPDTESHILIVDSKSSGTGGGTFTSGSWVTRDLNTERYDTGSHASVASNQITLAAGTYRVRASAPAFAVGRHQARLYDVSNTAVLVTGTSAHGSAPPFVQTDSLIVGRFTIAGSTVIELQHQCESTSATIGLGVPSGAAFTVAEEIYSIVELVRE